MALRKVLEKLCLMWFLLQDSRANVYTVEGSTVNLTFKDINSQMHFESNRNGLYFIHNVRSEANKYDLILRPNIIEFQLINVTANDTGIYWIEYWKSAFQLRITNMSCPPRLAEQVCAIKGSSPLLTFIVEDSVYYNLIVDGPLYFGSKRRIFSNFTIHVDLQIYNVTPEDEGYYSCGMIDSIELQVSNLWFKNQTDLKTIVGQEGEKMELNCTTSTAQYITVLKIETNGTVKAIGDNQSVSYVFIPDRTDHLTKYKCLDSTHSSIMIEVKLIIRYLWFTNLADLKTIVGQEGEEMEMNCTSNTAQYNTALQIETNGTVKAIGDNQSVSFLFIPDRTDHLTTYKCEDSTHSSIMIEVKLIIRYAPVFKGRFTNETIKCDCDGVPAMYSVYRLEQYSEDGKLVRSVNLNNETFPFNTEMFPYQKNGRYTCVVSNGIPDSNGNVLQTWSTNFKYEGSPVFAPENRNVKIGEVGQSITLSFYIYSYPEVEQIFVEKIGLNSFKSNKIPNYTISQSILRYTEYNNIAGMEGYEILIESDLLDIDDFQTYCITAKNQLGKTNYYFEIIDNENLPLSKRKRIYFVILSSIATLLLVYIIIINVCLCVKHIKIRDQRHHNVQEDHTYHTYDEIGTVSFRAVNNFRSADTNNNPGQNPTEQHTAGISTGANLQSTNANITELNADFLDDGLQQREITEVHRQSVSISLDDTNRSDLSRIPSTIIPSMDDIRNSNQSNESTNTKTSSDQKSQTCNDSDSGSSNNIMVGNVGDGYEHAYQLTLQDQPESHPYIEIISLNSISSFDADTNEEQRIETGSTKEPVYINLQF